MHPCAGATPVTLKYDGAHGARRTPSRASTARTRTLSRAGPGEQPGDRSAWSRLGERHDPGQRHHQGQPAVREEQGGAEARVVHGLRVGRAGDGDGGRVLPGRPARAEAGAEPRVRRRRDGDGELPAPAGRVGTVGRRRQAACGCRELAGDEQRAGAPGAERVRRAGGRGRGGRAHGVAVGGEQRAGDGRLRHVGRDGRERDGLHGRVGDADLRGRHHVGDGAGGDHGGLGGRERRDLHADAVEPVGRHAGRCGRRPAPSRTTTSRR